MAKHYEVVVLWLINKQEELLLARRSDTKEHDPGLWGPSVTGKVEADETVMQALLRETTEELGLAPRLYQPKHMFNEEFAHPDGAVRRFNIYWASVDKNDIDAKLYIDPIEVAETQWMTKKEMRELLTTEPGEVIPASAFTLWEKVFKKLETAT